MTWLATADQPTGHITTPAVAEIEVLAHGRVTLDLIDGGGFYLSGTVKVIEDGEEIPARKKILVMLPKQRFRIVAETTSDPITGSWIITGLVKRDYLVLCRDDDGNYNAAAFDWVQPG